MRRSSSTSRIPVITVTSERKNPEFLKKKRSISCNRLSIRDSHLPKLSYNSVKSTPVGSYRPSRMFTPGSVPSASRNKSPGTGSKDAMSIQKLTTDKHWVLAQHTKVIDYITYNLSEESIVNTSNIKPPSIKVFITFSNLLLNKLCKPTKLTNDNYKEELPKKLKILHYPGTITKSTLQTVNTMHSFPYVIVMWGWLIDRVLFVNNPIPDLSQLDEEDLQKYYITRLCTDYLCDSYLLFNNKESSDQELEACKRNFTKNFTDLLGINVEEHNRVVKEIEERNTNYENLCKYNEDLNDKIQALNVTKEEYQDITDNYEEKNANRYLELETEIEYYNKKKIEKLSLEVLKEKTEITRLKQTVEQQPYTKNQKKDTVKTCAKLKKTISIIQGDIEDAQTVAKHYEVQRRDKLEQCECTIELRNRLLFGPSISIPVLKTLLIPDENILSEGFFEKIKQISNKQKDLETELFEKIENMQTEKQRLTKELLSIVAKKESWNSQMKTAESKIQQLAQKLADTEAKTKQMSEGKDWESNILVDKEKSEGEIQSLKYENSILEQQKRQKSQDLEEFERSAIQFMIYKHNKIVERHTILRRYIKQKAELEINALKKADALLRGLVEDK